MSHPNERITKALAPMEGWRTAYPFIEAEAKRLLDEMPEGVTVLTTTLAAAIYDPEGPIDKAAQTRLYKALNACALNGLKPYVTVGEVEKIGNFGQGRRKIWHRAKAAQCCPTCKRPL